MYSIRAILITISNDSSGALLEWLRTIGEFSTGIGILLGAILGWRGLSRYITKDALKAKVTRIQAANDKVYEQTNKMLNELRNLKDDPALGDYAKSDHIETFQKLTKELLDLASGSSSQVNTLAFFLYESIRNVESQAREKTVDPESGEIIRERVENRTTADFLNLLQVAVIRINTISGVLIDVPRRTTTKHFNDIKKKVRPYLSKSGYKRIRESNFGIDPDPNAATSLVFYNILTSTTRGYIFKKRFFDVLGANNPILYDLWYKKIYFPAIITYSPEGSQIFGDAILHLISIQKRTKVIADEGEDDVDTLELVFSLISKHGSVQKELSLEKVIAHYKDAFLDAPLCIKESDILSFTTLTEHSVAMVCSLETAQKLFIEKKRLIKKQLRSLGGKNIRLKQLVNVVSRDT